MEDHNYRPAMNPKVQARREKARATAQKKRDAVKETKVKAIAGSTIAGAIKRKLTSAPVKPAPVKPAPLQLLGKKQPNETQKEFEKRLKKEALAQGKGKVLEYIMKYMPSIISSFKLMKELEKETGLNLKM